MSASQCLWTAAVLVGLGWNTAHAQGPVRDSATALAVGQQTTIATAAIFHRYGYRDYGYYGYCGGGCGYSFARPQLYVSARYPAYGYAWSSARPYYYSQPYFARPYYSPYAYPRYYSPYTYGSIYGSPYDYRPYYAYSAGYYRYGYYSNPSIAAFAYPYGYPSGYSTRGVVIYGF